MKITAKQIRKIVIEVLNEHGRDDDSGYERGKDIRAMGYDPSEVDDHYDEIYDDIWYSKPQEEVHPEEHDEEIERREEQESARRAAQSRFSRVIGNPYIDDY